MSDHALAIVFRNAHPQRTPIRSELCLLRGDSSSAHRDHPGHANSVDPKDQPRYLQPGNTASIALSQSPF